MTKEEYGPDATKLTEEGRLRLSKLVIFAIVQEQPLVTPEKRD